MGRILDADAENVTERAGHRLLRVAAERKDLVSHAGSSRTRGPSVALVGGAGVVKTAIVNAVWATAQKSGRADALGPDKLQALLEARVDAL